MTQHTPYRFSSGFDMTFSASTTRQSKTSSRRVCYWIQSQWLNCISRPISHSTHMFRPRIDVKYKLSIHNSIFQKFRRILVMRKHESSQLPIFIVAIYLKRKVRNCPIASKSWRVTYQIHRLYIGLYYRVHEKKHSDAVWLFTNPEAVMRARWKLPLG